jgi:hypothetical protein
MADSHTGLILEFGIGKQYSRLFRELKPGGKVTAAAPLQVQRLRR